MDHTKDAHHVRKHAIVDAIGKVGDRRAAHGTPDDWQRLRLVANALHRRVELIKKTRGYRWRPRYVPLEGLNDLGISDRPNGKAVHLQAAPQVVANIAPRAATIWIPFRLGRASVEFRRNLGCELVGPGGIKAIPEFPDQGEALVWRQVREVQLGGSHRVNLLVDS